jgi:prepilin-type N-terminal cleavage/methylation domain-containing protein
VTIPFRKSLRDFRGFTLVELLVVIAIIGILATLLLLQLGTARAKARDTKRIADVNQIRSALEFSFDDSGNTYPAAITDAILGKYMASQKVPLDPVTAAAYFYNYAPSGVGVKTVQFHLYTELESKNTSALNGDADLDSTAFTAPIAGSNGALGFDASGVASEACVAAYAAGAARDCIYDVGQR